MKGVNVGLPVLLGDSPLTSKATLEPRPRILGTFKVAIENHWDHMKLERGMGAEN